jgi:MYXO-CTERM domain-containing protein
MNYSRAVNFGDYYQAVELAAGDPNTVVTNYDEADLIANCTAGIFCNYFARLNVGTTTGSEASLAMSPAGDLLYAVWSQFNENTLVHDAQYARLWYTDENTFDIASFTGSVPGDYDATDDPTIGGGGEDVVEDGDDTLDTGGGCSVAGGNTAIDPLFPAVVLGALGYLGLRRRMAKVSR